MSRIWRALVVLATAFVLAGLAFVLVIHAEPTHTTCYGNASAWSCDITHTGPWAVVALMFGAIVGAGVSIAALHQRERRSVL